MSQRLSICKTLRRSEAVRTGWSVVLWATLLALVQTQVVGAEHRQMVGEEGDIPAAGLQFSTGHQGAVTQLVTWEAGSLLLSAGKDGTLRIWEAREGKLRDTVSLTDGEVTSLVLHPRKPHAYAVAIDDAGVSLVGWDWQQEHLMFSVDADDRPLFMGLSRTSESLLIGRASYDGPWLLDSSTGDRQPGLERDGGIVTFAATSSDERTVLTYQPSGLLTYRYRATGKVHRSLSVPSELVDLSLSGDRRYLIGRIGQWLVSVDAVTGVEMDRRRVDGLRLMKLWSEANRVLVVADGKHGLELRALPLAAGRFWAPVIVRRVIGVPTALGHGREEIFVGLSDGTILWLDLRQPEPEFTVFARDERLKVLDVAVAGDTIALGTEAGAITITADFVSGRPLWLSSREPMGIEAHVFRRPFGTDADGAARVTVLDSDRVLVWSEGVERGIAVLELYEARLGPLQEPLSAPMVNMNVVDGIIAAVDRVGQAVFLVPRTGPFLTKSENDAEAPLATVFETLFSATIPGTTDVVAGERAGSQAMVAALTSFGTLGTSIVSITSSTGETVAVRDSRSFVYDLTYDPRARTLYSLGIQPGLTVYTSLIRHAGPWFDQRRTIFEFPAEDLGAAVVVDARNGDVYFSLAGRVRVWDGRRVRILAGTGRMARQLAVYGGRVYAVNADGTLSVWSAHTLAHQFDLHIWRDFEWIVTTPDRYWTSRYGARYVLG